MPVPGVLESSGMGIYTGGAFPLCAQSRTTLGSAAQPAARPGAVTLLPDLDDCQEAEASD
jgi:hypothetical protein